VQAFVQNLGLKDNHRQSPSDAVELLRSAGAHGADDLTIVKMKNHLGHKRAKTMPMLSDVSFSALSIFLESYNLVTMKEEDRGGSVDGTHPYDIHTVGVYPGARVDVDDETCNFTMGTGKRTGAWISQQHE
jgi:hypothetical protein